MKQNNIAIVVVIVVMLSLSGCIAPDTPPTVVPTPTPTSTPTPTPTPTPASAIAAPTPTPVLVLVNDTDGSIYDNHSAAWLYAEGYYGNGGGSSRHSYPANPIPETATFYCVAVGLFGLCLFSRRSS